MERGVERHTNGLDLTVTQPGQTVRALFTALAGNEVSLPRRFYRVIER